MHVEPVDEAREYAIATLKRKRKFAQDLVAYVAVNGLLWLIWLFTGHSTNGSIPWPAWVSLAWGFFLALTAGALIPGEFEYADYRDRDRARARAEANPLKGK